MPDIRVLSAAEVETLVAWAGAEGWNPGIGDAQAFRMVDPDGFLGAFVNGEMAAGIAAVAYDDGFGFIGLYICRPESRGKGFGRAVWDAGMARLGSRTVGLDGVAEQQANYRAMGFRPCYDTLRHSGRPDGQASTGETGWTVAPFAPAMLDAVLALDRACFPAERPGFLRAWLGEPRGALVAVRDGRIGGFGVLRRCLAGQKAGPLFAVEEAAAQALFRALAQRADGEIVLDVPEPQASFRRFLTRCGMAPGFRTARMFRGDAPTFSLESVYGVTTLELG